MNTIKGLDALIRNAIHTAGPLAGRRACGQAVVSRWLQLCLTGLLMTALTACVVTPQQQYLRGSSARFPASFQQFLAQAPPGSSAQLAESPWGDHVTVYARGSYHAASDRVCRQLTIVKAGMRRPGLVCTLPAGGWETVTPLLRLGQARHPRNITQYDQRSGQ